MGCLLEHLMFVNPIHRFSSLPFPSSFFCLSVCVVGGGEVHSHTPAGALQGAATFILSTLASGPTCTLLPRNLHSKYIPYWDSFSWVFFFGLGCMSGGSHSAAALSPELTALVQLLQPIQAAASAAISKLIFSLFPDPPRPPLPSPPPQPKPKPTLPRS